MESVAVVEKTGPAMDIEKDPPEETTDEETVALPSGNPLTLEEANEILAHEPSRFVVIMGATGSGKTTLIASLYQMFLTLRDERFLFAGSKTLVAFEKRAFYTRTISHGTHPATMRTPRGAVDILHFRLYEKDRRRRLNLLLSDFSGEDYEQARANPVAAQEDFPQIRTAKAVIVLADGENLASTRKRQKEIQKCIHLLKTFCDGDLIAEGAVIVLAVSKYDLISPLEADARSHIDKMVKQSFQEQLPELVHRIQFLNTAAMPMDKKMLSPYYGLGELLSLLFTERQAQEKKHTKIQTTSQFDLWGERAEV